MLKELLKLFVFVFFLIPLEKAFATVRTFEASVSLSELFAPQADWQAGIIGNISGGGTLTVKIYYKESNTLVYQKQGDFFVDSPIILWLRLSGT